MQSCPYPAGKSVFFFNRETKKATWELPQEFLVELRKMDGPKRAAIGSIEKEAKKARVISISHQTRDEIAELRRQTALAKEMGKVRLASTAVRADALCWFYAGCQWPRAVMAAYIQGLSCADVRGSRVCHVQPCMCLQAEAARVKEIVRLESIAKKEELRLAKVVERAELAAKKEVERKEKEQQREAERVEKERLREIEKTKKDEEKRLKVGGWKRYDVVFTGHYLATFPRACRPG